MEQRRADWLIGFNTRLIVARTIRSLLESTVKFAFTRIGRTRALEESQSTWFAQKEETLAEAR